ncbi:2-nitropropane dioxygenase [Fusobacterium vincentii ATCC 51190]|nr:Gx transporter family protein [Fusobacterium vincentii]EJG10025.1 2-nitropropane dioxygenase [Fusobacterium vincentii ATCC 51190]
MKELKGIKIGKYYIEKPIVQGGMGVGVSWDQLAGTVSKNGGLGTISGICTAYYDNLKYCKKVVNGRPIGAEALNSKEAMMEIFKNARKICGDKPLACNILHAMNDYSKVVEYAIEAGANIIVTGAGLPLELPKLVENHPDVAIVPIVSSGRALKIICKKWKAAGRLPDAVIVEGPKSGGHQGVKAEDLFLSEHQLENIVSEVKEERDKWGDFPIIAAGGIWDNDDIQKIMELGADAVQLGTRFIGTYECDASEEFKNILINAKKEDIVIVKSPVIQALMLGTLFTPNFIISFSAGLISTLFMIFLYRFRKYLSLLSISCISAFTHNLLQLIVVYFLLFRNISLNSKSIIIFIVIFLGLGVIMGLITGVITSKINLKRNKI